MSTVHTLRVVSVMDIGSYFVRMGIFQTGKAGISRLEYLEQPLRLGHEVFATGRISVETVRQLSAILRGFSQIMREYEVSEYRAIATTALREATNRSYVLDQLRIQNNLTVEVLEDGEESALVYGTLMHSSVLQGRSLLSYVGTGSVGVAAYEDGTITRTCNITLGFLKLSEILHSLEDQTTHFYQVLEEYVDAYFHRLPLRMGKTPFPHIFLAGRELDTIAPLCGAVREKDVYYIERDKLTALYDRVKPLHTSMIAQTLGVGEEMAERLIPMLAIYLRMMSMTTATRMIVPRLSLMEVLAAHMLIPEQQRQFEALERQGALSTCRELALREQVDIGHADRVRTYSALLFNKLKKLHGISGKRLILLECAALVHEAGHMANVKNGAMATYDLIKQSYFFGLDEEETLLLAAIACIGDMHHAGYTAIGLPEKQRLLVDKLAAILALANALDGSRRGKITECQVKLEEERLIVTLSSRDELLLERWAFMDSARLFENAFGIQPVFVHKNSFGQ